MQHSSIDVIVPCYNYGHYLAGCIHSLTTQSGVDLRILIIDDASSDNTENISSTLLEKDSRIEYRKHQYNLGHLNTYNEGLSWSTAKYSLVLSADDALAPGALKRAVTALDNCPTAGFCYGQHISFNVDIPVIPPDLHFFSKEIEGTSFLHHVCSTGGNPVSTPTAVVRNSLLNKSIKYNLQLPHTADFELWMKLAGIANVVCLNCCQAFKRKHKSNMQRSFLEAAYGDIYERSEAFISAMRFIENCHPNFKSFDTTWRNTIAVEAIWSARLTIQIQRDFALADRLLDFAINLSPIAKNTKHFKVLYALRLINQFRNYFSVYGSRE